MTLYKLVMDAAIISVAVLTTIPFIYITYLSIRSLEPPEPEPLPVVQTWLDLSVPESTEQKPPEEKNTLPTDHPQ